MQPKGIRLCAARSLYPLVVITEISSERSRLYKSKKNERQHRQKPQQFCLSSPKSANPRARQAKQVCRLITFNLLALNQDQNRKPPQPPEAILFPPKGKQSFYNEYFTNKLLRMNTLQ
jgi:hypothetical protein